MLAIERSGTIEIVPVDEAVSVRVYDVRGLLKRKVGLSRGSGFVCTAFNSSGSASDSFDLIRLLTNIDAANWYVNGGSYGEMSGFAGLLMAKTTEENHRQIAALLAALEVE